MAANYIYNLAGVLAFIEAIWSSMVGCFLVLDSNERRSDFHNLMFIFGMAYFFEALLYLGVFVGLRKKRPAFFFPYLIGEVTYICIWSLFATTLLSAGSKGIPLLIPGIFSIFCYIIILMAHRRMKQEIFDQMPSVVFEFLEDGRVAIIKDGTKV